MIASETIRSILDSAVQAPSGENAQPWRFEVAGDRISLFNIPEHDRSLYNFEQRASYISHGAVIENIVIAAAHFALTASIAIALDTKDPDLIAVISFAPGGANKDAAFYPLIAKRSTNRKIYNGGVISDSTIKELIDTTIASNNVRITFATQAADIDTLAIHSSVNDMILLENKSIHDFFFSHVHWTLEEEEKKRSGFYIEVLELLPPARAMFKFFKYWPIMRIFNALGAARMGAKENSKIYASASAFGIITVSDEKKLSFIDAGRTLQRLWLTATANGLSMQPLTGVLFFHQRIQAGEGREFPEYQKVAIEKAYQGIRAIFAIENRTIAVMFRIGYADSPTASSLKKPPEIINT